jgi:hypothetical protein
MFDVISLTCAQACPVPCGIRKAAEEINSSAIIKRTFFRLFRILVVDFAFITSHPCLHADV